MKINYCREVQEEFIKYDLYVPINIEFGKWNIIQEPMIYWRTGDFHKSLLEVGIGEYNYEIRSITLVICDRIHEGDFVYKKPYDCIVGCPIASFDNLDVNLLRIDEKASIEVYIINNRVYILFSKNEITNCIVNQNVTFLLDFDKKLIGLSIENISENDMNILLNY